MTRSVRPVRVMYVVPDLEIGGAERHVATLMPRLDPARFTCSVVCIGVEGTLFGDLVDAGIPAVALRRTKRQALAAVVDLVREMRRRRSGRCAGARVQRGDAGPDRRDHCRGAAPGGVAALLR